MGEVYLAEDTRLRGKPAKRANAHDGKVVHAVNDVAIQAKLADEANRRRLMRAAEPLTHP